MQINLENANKYFAPGNHAQSELWLKFTAAHRSGAIAQARRMFEMELRRPMRESDPEQFDPASPRRDDYAVFEQALWLLLGSPYGNGAGGDAVAVLQGAVETAEGVSSYADGKRERWSREALRWLGWGGIVTVRS